MVSELSPKPLKGRTILIMAGGTGGHIFPALAVADQLQQKGANIVWLGTRYGIEKQHVTPQFQLQYLHVRGIRQQRLWRKFLMPFSLIASIWQARRIIKQHQADLVIGFGGYVSGPGGIAAWMCRKPLFIHEQNAIVGWTNQQLARFAKQIFCGFPDAGFKTSAHQVQVVGNPIRLEISQQRLKKKDFYAHDLNILVVGGSQGAEILNQVVPNTLKQLPESVCPNVWHQAGPKWAEATQQRYQQLQTESQVQVNAFIQDMAHAYAWAHIVICRAGALTVSELAAVGLPAIFVPFPSAVDDHQFHNAQQLVRAGGGVCIRQEHLTPEKLAAYWRMYDLDRSYLINQSQQAKQWAKTQAAELITNQVCKQLDQKH